MGHSTRCAAALSGLPSSEAALRVQQYGPNAMWSSRPRTILLICSLADLFVVPTLAFAGILLVPLPLSLIPGVLGGALVFAFALDAVKARLFPTLGMK